ncbi:hypothetical protein AMEX_G13017 [Astyanax mexicanus]|uniref:Uncharacterized protein n=1 Tax=Astyanax mexicanus TaxID=7994 RepID=A0A8T2LKJ7_ASTMX|nr:hypothetical protein AMEX_G13017 [Astyanax mexicanus]
MDSPKSRALFILRLSTPPSRGHGTKITTQDHPGTWSCSRASPAVPQHGQESHSADCSGFTSGLCEKREAVVQTESAPLHTALELHGKKDQPKHSSTCRAARTAWDLLSAVLLFCGLLFVILLIYWHIHGVARACHFPFVFDAPLGQIFGSRGRPPV